MKPCFYSVATPIGNRDDITTRALQVLGDVDFIVAEDTRHTGELLAYYGIKKPLISFRDAPSAVMQRSIKQVQDRIAKGQNGAYVTDAGTPGVSDPGWRLIESLLADATIAPIPGPAAVTALVSIAHVPLDEYRFIGFLPKKKGYQTKLAELCDYLNHKEKRAVVFYESPRRIRKTLTDFMGVNSKLKVIIGRELTKKFETVSRAQLSTSGIKSLPEKGEYVVLLYL